MTTNNPNQPQNQNQTKMNTEFGSATDVNQVRKQNQASAAGGSKGYVESTNAQKVRQQNQQSAANMQQGSSFAGMSEEFGSETDVNQVQKQIQQAEKNKVAGARANLFEDGSR